MIVAGSLLLWIPICAILFASRTPARAAAISYLGGWLLLPALAIPLQGFWDIDKTLVIALGVMVGAICFVPNPLRGFRLHFADLLLVGFAASSAVTSMTNELGVNDAFSSFTNKLLYYGVAYWAGRAFLRDRRDLLDVLRLVVCAAALYAVLALWEWRMSPQIHNLLYGHFQHSFYQHKRWGFYRPILCFPHALSLGMFFAWSSLIAVWLFRSRLIRPLLGLPPIIVVGLPLLGLMSSMSMSPWAMFAAGFCVLMGLSITRWKPLLWTPVFFAAIWMTSRYTGATDGEWLVSLAAEVSAERAESLQYRIDAETVLLDHAKEQHFFGWGGWGRNQVRKESGKLAFANDALWVIYLGQYGLVGVGVFYLWWCWPLLMISFSQRNFLDDPGLTVMLVGIGMQAVDGLFNGVMSPLLIFVAGGTLTTLTALRVAASAQVVSTARAGIAPPLIGVRPRVINH